MARLVRLVAAAASVPLALAVAASAVPESAVAAGGALGTPVDSILDFPTPYQKATQGALADAGQYGVTVTGLAFAGGLISGNVDAPVSGAFGSLFSSTTATFGFAVPRNRVGVCVADIDFGVDVPARITLKAFDATGALVAESSGTLLPANSLDQENRLAIFVGVLSDTPFDFVELSTDVQQTTAVDNLVFDRQ